MEPVKEDRNDRSGSDYREIEARRLVSPNKGEEHACHKGTI
jgi:hypothetical protein